MFVPSKVSEGDSTTWAPSRASMGAAFRSSTDRRGRSAGMTSRRA